MTGRPANQNFVGAMGSLPSPPPNQPIYNSTLEPFDYSPQFLLYPFCPSCKRVITSMETKCHFTQLPSFFFFFAIFKKILKERRNKALFSRQTSFTDCVEIVKLICFKAFRHKLHSVITDKFMALLFCSAIANI